MNKFIITFPKLEKFGQKFFIPLNILAAVIFGITCKIAGGAGIAGTVIAAAVFAVCTFLCRFSQIGFKGDLLGFILSAALSYSFSVNSNIIDINSISLTKTLLITAVGTMFLNYIFTGYRCCLFESKFDKSQFAGSLMGTAPLLFTLCIYLPGDTFINNVNDFDFRIQNFIFIMLGIFLLITLALSAAAATFNEKGYKAYRCVLLGLNVCVYIQYMFLNRNLGVLMVGETDWDKHILYSLLTAVLWVAIMIVPFIIKKKNVKVCKKISSIVPMFIGGIEVLTIAFMIINADSRVFNYQNVSGTFIADEQFKISKGENVITIIVDNFDTSFFKKVDKQDKFSEYYKDFTWYTNTCSYYPLTIYSVNSIFTGDNGKLMENYDKDYPATWKTKKAEEFYGRFHKAGYKMNFYVQVPNYKVKNIGNKIDNFKSVKESPEKVNYLSISKYMINLSLYRGLPYTFKRFTDVNSSSIENAVIFKDAKIKTNADFDKRSKELSFSDEDKNFFIVQHIDGSHYPYASGDIITESEVALTAVESYINKLKELGVYDKTSIVIMADHGAHELFAGTPLLMVKPAGQVQDKIKENSAPVHSRDYMPTYLKLAGLYKQGDEELFGKTLFDWKEDDVRERELFPQRYMDDSMRKYDTPPVKYTGDADDMAKAVVKSIQQYHLDHDK